MGCLGRIKGRAPKKAYSGRRHLYTHSLRPRRAVPLRILMRLTAQRSLMGLPQQQYRNRVLAALPEAEIERLRPHLTPLSLEQHKSLLDGQADYAYFLEDGIASVVVTVQDGGTVEIGVI